MSKKLRLIIYLFFIVALLFPLVVLTNAVNYTFFRDTAYISVSLSLFIILWFIINKFKLIVFRIHLLDVLVLLYFFYNIFNLLLLNNTNFKANYAFPVLLPVLYFVLKLFFKTEREINTAFQKHFVVCMLIIGIIPNIISGLEYIGILPSHLGYAITGGFTNPGLLANFTVSVISFPLAVIFLIGNKSKGVKIFAIIVLFLAVTIIILSNARSGWIAGIVLVLYMFVHITGFIAWLKKILDTWFKKILIASLLTIVIGISSIMLYNYKKDSADGRMFIWKICTDIIKEKPIFGHGYHGFITSYNNAQMEYFSQNSGDTKNGMLAYEAKFAFNDYLQILTETGLIGILLFFGIIIWVFVKKRDPHHTQTNYLLIATRAGILSMLVSALFSYPLQSAINYTLLIVYLSYVSAHYDSLGKGFTIQKFQLPLSLIVFVFVSFILYNQLMFFRYSYKWKEVGSQAGTKNIIHALDLYKTIEPFLSSNYPFMFNYGSILYNGGKFEESVRILEAAKKLNTSYDLYINLGDCYEKTKQYDKTEEYLLNASNLIPHKLTPKYKLFKLYCKTNQTKKAYKMASLIHNMQIKVYSPLAGYIKTEAIEYMRNTKLPNNEQAEEISE